MAKRAHNEEELKALLDEVTSLRQDIEILKANPLIGQALKRLSSSGMSSTSR
jgi:hypothetical protein